MKQSVKTLALFLFSLVVALSACTTAPITPSAEASSPSVAFIDLDKFDRQLSSSLTADLPQVEVSFLERVSPNQMPERMKVWLNHIESNGGRIQVQEPPSSSGVTAKNPFVIFTIINAIKTLSDFAAKQALEKNFFQHAKGHDAKVILRHGADNELIVDKIIFVKTSKP